MSDTTDDLDWTPPAGHNIPPLDLAEALSAAALAGLLDQKLAEHRARCDTLIAADVRFSDATKAGISDDDTAGKATDFVRQLKAASKAADQCREVIKAPVLAAQRQIDGEAKKITVLLDAAASRAEDRVRAYLKQKETEEREKAQREARLREEEARRLIAEAEAAEVSTETVATERAIAAIDAAENARRAAAASAADMSRTRTTLGGVASLRKNWVHEVTDKVALLRAVVAGEASADYVMPNDPVLKALAKSQEDKAKVPGVVFRNDAGVTIR